MGVDEQLPPSLLTAPLEYRIFFMHMVGLQFSETEFRKMPSRRFRKYLSFAYMKNEKDKEHSK